MRNGSGSTVSGVRPGRSDDESRIEASSRDCPDDAACRTAENELSALLLHAPQGINEDREAGCVDERHCPKVENEPQVSLSVDRVDQPLVKFGRSVLVDGTVNVDDDITESATERQ